MILHWWTLEDDITLVDIGRWYYTGGNWKMVLHWWTVLMHRLLYRPRSTECALEDNTTLVDIGRWYYTGGHWKMILHW